MLLHLLPGALFWSIIFHHYAGSAIMNNEKKKEKKKRGAEKKQNIEKETVFGLSQLPRRWWCLLWLNVESWRDRRCKFAATLRERRLGYTDMNTVTDLTVWTCASFAILNFKIYLLPACHSVTHEYRLLCCLHTFYW